MTRISKRKRREVEREKKTSRWTDRKCKRKEKFFSASVALVTPITKTRQYVQNEEI